VFSGSLAADLGERRRNAALSHSVHESRPSDRLRSMLQSRLG